MSNPRDVAHEHDPFVGKTLENRYAVLERIGSGAMGVSYRAAQLPISREVVVKVLRREGDARLLRDARATSHLSSSNTATVFDFGQCENGELFLARELVQGESLAERLSRLGKLPVLDAVDVARQACLSLSEAHAKGITHRDLKPNNVFFARVAHASGDAASSFEEIVKVVDFALATSLPPDEAAALALMDAADSDIGTVFGTPRYMSPEQAQGKRVDARSDLYSLAAIVYEMVTGRPPFTDAAALKVLARHVRSTPRRPREVAPDAEIPLTLERVIMRALSKSPDDRHASADEFSTELLASVDLQVPPVRRYRDSETVRRRVRKRGHWARAWRVGAWLALAIVVGSVGAVAIDRGLFRRRRAVVSAPTPAADSSVKERAPASTSTALAARQSASTTTLGTPVNDLPSIAPSGSHHARPR